VGEKFKHSSILLNVITSTEFELMRHLLSKLFKENKTLENMLTVEKKS